MLVVRDYFLCDVSIFLRRAEVTDQGLRAPLGELAFICGEIAKFYEYKVINELQEYASVLYQMYCLVS